MKKQLAQLLKPLSSNRVTKPFFYKLYSFALFGLYGDEWHFERNGEVPFVKSVLKRFASEPLITVFDVGANVGDYSANILRIAGERKIVIHAFEPSRKTFETYSAKFISHPQVKRNNFGLSDQAGDLDLYIVEKSSGFASLYMDEGKKNFESTERIHLETVDGYCEREKIPEIHFMKIDVEGHEVSVLKGARQMMAKKGIRVVQFEFGARNLSSRTFFYDFYRMFKTDYNLYRIVKNGLVRVETYDYKLEVFGRALNYAAIQKSVDWN